MTTSITIAIAGAIGVLFRHGIDRLFSSIFSLAFPYSTFLINIMGSFALGIVYVVGSERSLLGPSTYLAIAVGLLGGFTTFSSFSLQAALLIEEQRLWLAFVYLIFSPVLGLAAAFLGIFVGRTIS